MGDDRRAKREALDRRLRACSQPDHIAFSATTRDQVRAFHEAAIAAGDNGGPGIRANYGPTYYAAFV